MQNNTDHIKDVVLTRDASTRQLIETEVKRTNDLRQHQDRTIEEIKGLWRGLSADLYGDADSPGMIPRFRIVEEKITAMYDGQKAHHKSQIAQSRRFWVGILTTVITTGIALIMSSCYGSVVLPTYEALRGTSTPTATTIPSAVPETPTAPAYTLTPTITLTPTSQIVEVTPLGGIIWLGDINSEPPPPGVWDFTRRGQYTSYNDWRIRACPDIECGVISSLRVGQTVNTVGAALDLAGATWLCAGQKPNIDYGEDEHGAQWCDRSFLAREPDGSWHGNYITLPDPTLPPTSAATPEQGTK